MLSCTYLASLRALEGDATKHWRVDYSHAWGTIQGPMKRGMMTPEPAVSRTARSCQKHSERYRRSSVPALPLLTAGFSGRPAAALRSSPRKARRSGAQRGCRCRRPPAAGVSAVREALWGLCVEPSGRERQGRRAGLAVGGWPPASGDTCIFSLAPLAAVTAPAMLAADVNHPCL